MKNYMNKEDLINKAKEENVNIIKNKDNKVIFEIKNFEQSAIFGSQDWAISRMSNYFEGYSGGDKQQYFVYDYNKNFKDKDFLIGITLNAEDKLEYAYYQNCEPMQDKSIIKEFLNDAKPITKITSKIRPS